MFSKLIQFTRSRFAWLLLASLALGLETTALYFQHVMKLSPCVMCVYERLAMLLLVAAGVVGAIKPTFWLIRLIGFALWGTGSIWGLMLAIRHTDYQLNPSIFNTCEAIPTFPFNLPLEQWIPWLFAPSGECSDIVWSFLGLSMPQWLIPIFILFSLACLLFFPLQFFYKK